MSGSSHATGGQSHDNDDGNLSDQTEPFSGKPHREIRKSPRPYYQLSLADLCVSKTQKKRSVASFSSPSEMVTVIVGSDTSETFILHKEHAVRCSPAFEKAFNGSFAEADSGTLTLEEQHPGAFRHLMQWIYRGKFNDLITAQQIPPVKSSEEKTPLAKQFDTQTTELLNLWILADYLQIPRVQNQVIECLILTGPFPFPLLVSLSSDIYKRTAPDSRLRKFLARTCAWNLKPSDLDDVSKDVEKDFLIDLVRTFRGSTPSHTIVDKKAEMVGKHFYVKVADKF